MIERTRLDEATAGTPPMEHIALADYQRFISFVYETCGIQLGPSKQPMVETRLRKRLKATGVKSYREYWALLTQSNEETEIVAFIDAMTTNKTEFFREPAHFDYLVNELLPDLGPRLKSSRRRLRVWSAGCSSGKEAYTLAMVLKECQQARMIHDFEILGTDISTEVLAAARRAVYQPQDIEAIPEDLRKKYLLRSRNADPPSFRIAPELRSTVRFERINFMDESYAADGVFDIIFCRNVIIYFDRATQKKVVNRLGDCLAPGGHFFTGHSETLNGLGTPLISVAPTIYQKGNAK